MKKNRTCHNLFDRWNEQSAYIIGFWIADGYITFARRPNRTYKQFGFSNTDEQIITYLCKVFNCNRHKLNTKKPNKKAYLVRVYSDKLFDFCYKLVGTTRKSIAEITLPSLPDEMFHHLIRGFFDGDGSIYWVKMKTRHGKLIKNLKTSFTAGLETGNFLNDLIRKIGEHVPIKKTNIYVCNVNESLFELLNLQSAFDQGNGRRIANVRTG